MSKEHFDRLAEAVSNWGRWGDDDERGTLNLIDDAARARGAAAVVDGRAFSLALPLDAEVPATVGYPRRTTPSLTLLSHDDGFLPDDPTAWSDDQLVTATQAGTHWDALAHVSVDGRIYNGAGVDTITALSGATRAGIDKAGPIVGRGVLLDVARARGVARLDERDPVTPADLDLACDRAGVELAAGDIALVRTGWMSRWLAGSGAEKKAYVSGSPGFALETARWLRDRDVAAMAADLQNPDAFPSPVPEMLMPFGALALTMMGLTLGQNWNLEALAADCAADGRHTVLLAASPLPITGGLGSPVDPTAVK